MRIGFRVCILLTFLATAEIAAGQNYSQNEQAARKFGVHEIALTGNGGVANPFDVAVTVTFSPPDGQGPPKTVHAFHDGGNTWRARVYVESPGEWTWVSRCQTDPALNLVQGRFTAADSSLRGRLLVHPRNPRQWSTENGRWFLNLNDTAYFLLSTHDGLGQPVPMTDMQKYVADATAAGLTSVRCFLSSGDKGFHDASNSDRHRWFDIVSDESVRSFNLPALQTTDHRLRWLLDESPDLYVQLILFPLDRYGRDDTFWKALGPEQKERILRHLVARYAAFPQLFWLVANDVHYGERYPSNNAFAREVGRYFQDHDPWRHPMSAGHARRIPFFFGDEDWATYIHIEDEADLSAQKYGFYHRLAKPVFLGEDRYEQDHGPVRDPADMPYFQRRLFWSWLMAGGCTNYGGRWWVVHPYSETGQRAPPPPRKNGPSFTAPLNGLSSVPHIGRYFLDRKLDLGDFEPDHSLVTAPSAAEVPGVKLMGRGLEELLVYHPNAASDGKEATVAKGRTARFTVDLSSAPGPWSVEWYRPMDGIAEAGDPVTGGQLVDLSAPWPGCDVVARLTARR